MASNAEAPSIRVEHIGRVAKITLDRPTKLNAMSKDMVATLITSVEGLVNDPNTRVLVLTGAGRMFSAGADVDEFAEEFGRGEVDPVSTEAEARLGSRLTAALESPELVTIAAVHSAAIGGAAALIAACDLRVFSSDARMIIPELSMGFPLAWGGVERIGRDLGPSVTRDLLLTGRPLKAQEALDRGFVCRVVPAGEVVDSAMELAQEIAAKPAFGTTAVLQRILAISDRSKAEGIDDDAETLARASSDPEALASAREYLNSISSSTDS